MRSLLVLLAATCSTAAAGDVVAQEIAPETVPVAQAVSVPAEANYEVGPGDILSLEVFGEEDLTLELQVDRDGNVTLPYVGGLAVSGKTSDEVAVGIDAALRDGYLVDPKVAVRVIEYRSRPVSVVSGVQNAGIYYMTGRMSVLDVIALAGGSPESSTRARVVRDTPTGQVSYDLDLQAITAGQVEPFYMEPEDQLHVLAPVVVFVTGDHTGVWLVSPTGRTFKPGEALDPGTYQVKASFAGGSPVVAGKVKVSDGSRVTLACDSQFWKCQER